MLTCSLWRPLPALGSLACSRARRLALKPSISRPCCSARAAIACCEELAYLQTAYSQITHYPNHWPSLGAPGLVGISKGPFILTKKDARASQCVTLTNSKGH